MLATFPLPWIWDWSPDALIAAGTWTTAVVAAIAAGYAAAQVKTARQVREDQTQPFVVVDFAKNGSSRILVDMIIKNTGSTLAQNVKVVFDPALESTLSQKDRSYALADAAIITRGIPTLPPGREYRMLFDHGPDRWKSELPRTYSAVVTFEGPHGKPYRLEYRLDLDIYYGVMNTTVLGVHDAAKELQNLRKLLASKLH